MSTEVKTQPSPPPLPLQLKEALPTLYVDSISVNPRADGLYFVRFSAIIPEGVSEQCRFIIDKPRLDSIIDTLCQVADYYPDKPGKTIDTMPADLKARIAAATGQLPMKQMRLHSLVRRLNDNASKISTLTGILDGKIPGDAARMEEYRTTRQSLEAQRPSIQKSIDDAKQEIMNLQNDIISLVRNIG